MGRKKKEREALLPLKRLPAHLDGKQDGGVSAWPSKSPKPVISMEGVGHGPPMVLWQVECECWGAHPRGSVLAFLYQEAWPLGKTLACPIPVPPSSPPLPLLTCGASSRGSGYQGSGREAWSWGSVCPLTHMLACPPTHMCPETRTPGRRQPDFSSQLSPLFFPCPMTRVPSESQDRGL